MGPTSGEGWLAMIKRKWSWATVVVLAPPYAIAWVGGGSDSWLGCLGKSMKRRWFAVLMVVTLAGLLSAAWGLWRLTRQGEGYGRPAGLLPLSDAGAFAADQQAGARAVADAVVRSGERPEEFFAEVDAGSADGIVVFHLWHRSAWNPENRGVVGNPGGKCRDVYYDAKRGEVIRTLFWQ